MKIQYMNNKDKYNELSWSIADLEDQKNEIQNKIDAMKYTQDLLHKSNNEIRSTLNDEFDINFTHPNQ